MTHGSLRDDFDQSDWYTLILSFLPFLMGMMVNLRWTGMLTRLRWEQWLKETGGSIVRFSTWWGPFIWMISYLFYGVSVFFFFRTGVDHVSYHVFSLAMGFAIASAILSLAWHGTFLWGPNYWIAGSGISATSFVTSLVSTIFMAIGAVGHGGKHPHLWVGFAFMLAYTLIQAFTAVALLIMAWNRAKTTKDILGGFKVLLGMGVNTTRDAARGVGLVNGGAQYNTQFAGIPVGIRNRAPLRSYN